MFATTYSLFLPAITLEYGNAKTMAGISFTTRKMEDPHGTVAKKIVAAVTQKETAEAENAKAVSDKNRDAETIQAADQKPAGIAFRKVNFLWRKIFQTKCQIYLT